MGQPMNDAKPDGAASELGMLIHELCALVGDGERFYLKFGNGVCMYNSDGEFVAGGYEHVANAICAIRPNDQLTATGVSRVAVEAPVGREED